MCGGGPKGPSSEELIAQEQAAQARAKTEIDRMNAERELEKEAENAKMVAEQAAQANTDAARRASNRTLLAGLAAEEELELEDPKSQSTAKRKRATLISTGGE
jgi:hypothetical protein